jgi:hypothetical protein
VSTLPLLERNKNRLLFFSVVDLHHQDADPDLDPDCACHFDANPDLVLTFHLYADLDPDLTYHFYADLDLDPNFKIKAQNLAKVFKLIQQTPQYRYFSSTDNCFSPSRSPNQISQILSIFRAKMSSAISA